MILVAQPDDRGARVDQLVAKKHPELSRARVQALIADGFVLIEGEHVKASHRVRGGELISVEIPEPVAAEPQAEKIPLRVVHEDDDLLVVDKAAGMVVHPGAGHASGTLVNALLHHVKNLKGVGGELRPGIVHRLDKDTSGLLIIAKHDESLRALQEAFKSRAVKKTYVALVLGKPPDAGTFETLHGRHPTNRMRFTGKVKTGKKAVTHFKVTERFGNAARVEIDLETGRTHQIRMHFAEAGFPLFGDELYGGKRVTRKEIIERQALHAWKLSLVHPQTGRTLNFTAPLPADMKRAQKALSR
ncbi:MAG: RluA family pseudouridine synthase [Archangium sp.]|nr:RluA family pseudouridine synthase [Archangium sp.]